MRWLRFTYLLSTFLVAGLLVASGVQHAYAAVTAEQRQQLQQLDEATKVAGQRYAAGEYLECADSVEKIQTQLIALLAVEDRALHRMAKPIYANLARAHRLLEIEGAVLEPLPSWEDVESGKLAQSTGRPAQSMDTVSFEKDIAPWMVSACGRCHIDGRRGQFSMATVQSMLDGVRGAKVLYAGDAKGSRLVEVIESGDMPRGGGAVSPEQLSALKAWIDGGAKLTSVGLDQPIKSLVGNSQGAPDMSASNATAATMASADLPLDGISFAKHVAPILLENCNGCHIAGQRASGNLRMDTFTQLKRGGDSGEVIAGTNANNSLLIKKLKGQEGQRMPAGGRPPLSDEQITLISTWIREGAKFDGATPSMNIETLVNQSWADEADHETLFEKRKERTLANWRRVLPTDEPTTASNDEVFVLGNVQQGVVDETLTRSEEAIQEIKKSLRLPTKEPLLKGGLSIYVLKSPYDYSEFGKMTESRELPQSWLGHWRADPLDVYAVVSSNPEMEDSQAEALTMQVITGAYLGAQPGVPFWFAEGVARNLVVTNYRRGDDRLKQWQQNLPAAIQSVESSKMLLENRLEEESAGLVGMALTNFMMNKANRRRFDKMLELLREGRNFTEATTFAYAPPETLVKTWLGKK